MRIFDVMFSNKGRITLNVTSLVADSGFIATHLILQKELFLCVVKIIRTKYEVDSQSFFFH